LIIKQIYEPKLAQFSYLVASDDTDEAIVIDPMRDVDSYRQFAEQLGKHIVAVAETHIHADFVSGVREFASQPGIRIYAFQSDHPDWRYQWIENGDYDHQWMHDGDTITLGEVTIKVLHTPGHSPEHVSYVASDRSDSDSTPPAILSGDFVFVGDVGRPDLMGTTGGSEEDFRSAARTIYRSLDRFRELPGHFKVYPGHGAGSACGKSMSPFPSSTVEKELSQNIAIRAAVDEAHFVDHILDAQPEPPAYFGRMRQWNRQGPPVLDGLPEPAHISLHDIEALLKKEENVFLDTRSWYDFKAGHLPGSIFAPLDAQFNTLAGAYIDPERNIYLIVRPERLEEAVRDLIRVGLDNIAGVLTPEDLLHFARENGHIQAVSDVNVEELAELIDVQAIHPVDVRRISELQEIGYLPDASHSAHLRLSLNLDELPTDKPLAVYCRSGVRSTYATAFLQAQGFRVRNVNGGIQAWMAARFPVVPFSNEQPQSLQLTE